MPDDLTKRGREDQIRVSSQTHEIQLLAREFKLSEDVIRRIQAVEQSRPVVRSALHLLTQTSLRRSGLHKIDIILHESGLDELNGMATLLVLNQAGLVVLNDGLVKSLV